MKPRTLVLVGMVLVATLARVLPHPPNFTPIGAVALFGAAHFRGRWTAFLASLGAMFLGDLALEVASRLGLLGGWMAGGTGLYAGMWAVYLAVALVTGLGFLLRRHRSTAAIAACVLARSVLFFLVTNFAWWASYDLYPHTKEGLLLSYTAALPFFRWTLLGDAFFGTTLFGGFALAEKRYPALRPASLQP
jgi:hypothetical protein